MTLIVTESRNYHTYLPSVMLPSSGTPLALLSGMTKTEKQIVELKAALARGVAGSAKHAAKVIKSRMAELKRLEALPKETD